jgi:ABC-2 type transport system permease protein
MRWWKHVVAMELRKILAYRSDFWITFLGQTLIQLLVARALWQTIFASQGVTEMQGFTLEMMNLYYLIVPIGMRILSGENIGFMAREIVDGTFTRYLLYPLSVFQYKTLTYLTYSLFYIFQLFILYSCYRIFLAEAPFMMSDVANLLMGIILFMMAAMAYAMMAMMIEMISLWADNIWSLVVMLRFFTSFFGGGFIPLNFLPVWAQQTLQWTPFPYLVSLPARTIMGLTSFEEIAKGSIILMVWILVFMEGVKLIWRRGQNRYTGVGI